MSTNKIDFSSIYLERSDKETENLLSEEGQAFLQKGIDYLVKNKNEFIYFEGNPFEEIGIEGLSFEVDDIFGTYNVMLGLKRKKNIETSLKAYLDSVLKGDDVKYSLLFDGNEGLWNFNFTLNYVPGFSEEMSFQEAFTIIYNFLAELMANVK